MAITHLEKLARRSQQRRYPGDWVGHVIDGEGQPFDFGIERPHDCAEALPVAIHWSSPRVPAIATPNSVDPQAGLLILAADGDVIASQEVVVVP